MTTTVFSVLLILIGLVVIGRTFLAGVGGGLGLLIGALFLLGGALRLYLQRSTKSG
jgi:hypothetical protein